MRLLHYKGFEDFTLRLGNQAILVGPNNAGKTTLVHALRLVASLLKFARRRNANGNFLDTVMNHQDRWVTGHLLSAVGARELAWYKDENLRHEFREEPTGLEVTFSSKARLRVVWPVDDPAFFYIEKLPGMIARTPVVVRACTPNIGVIPTLVPVEHREEVLSAQYVRESVGTRLTSRHFRNQLYQLRTESEDRFDAFAKFAIGNTPEITTLSLRTTYVSGYELDLYLTEAATHKEKEVYWLGDGLQVWLQVLLHLWLNDDVDTLVLDEPDVFLHPDLQRRLVALLEDLGRQVVIATHAPEIINEASNDAVIWVDRTRHTSRRAKDAAGLARLNVALGSGFNLGLARAMRSRVALFVEGDDMKLLRNIARAVGAERLRGERGLAVIPLGGFSNWHQVEPFAWLSRNLLGDAVSVFVILDRDYRTDMTVDELTTALSRYNVQAHIWHRKELESYLLVPAAIARVSGLTVDAATRILNEAIDSTRVEAQSSFISRRQLDADRGTNPKTVMRSALPEFDSAWADPIRRVELAPPKEVIAKIAGDVQALGARPVSARRLSAALRGSEVDPEVAELLGLIEDELGRDMRSLSNR